MSPSKVFGRSLSELTEPFQIVGPIDVESRELYIHTKETGAVFKLPIAVTFIGLGYYPYLPLVDPILFPDWYGISPYQSPASGQTFWNWKSHVYSLYNPPGAYFYMKQIDTATQPVKWRKKEMTLSERNQYLDSISTGLDHYSKSGWLPGSKLRAYRIRQDWYEDEKTIMQFSIWDKFMKECQ